MNKKGILTIIIVSLILGAVIARQLALSKRINSQVKPENNQALAYEVSELFNSNENLKEEVDKLSAETEKLKKSYLNSKQADEALEDKLKNYKILLGISDINGPGVKIEFDKKIASTQLIDLINNLKNIDAEAIAINGKRITLSGSISNGIFNPPMIVEIIGDKDLLKSSLSRPGGIMDQIGFGQIVTVDKITLSSI